MIPRVSYSMGVKGLHRASPEANLLLLFGFLAAVLAAPGVMVKLGTLVLVFILATLSGERVRAFLRSTRFVLIFAASMLFVMVTDPDRFAHSLIRLGIPYRYGFILVLALRFVPFFRQELKTVREAQQVRGVSPSIRNFSGLRKAIHYTFLPVLVSGLTRVDSIAISMKGQESHWGRVDWVVVGLFLILVGITIVARRYTWP
jgi:energy-coupling factor transport system permease protein